MLRKSLGELSPVISSDWRALITRSDVDLVSIVTPPFLHHDQALEALKVPLCSFPSFGLLLLLLFWSSLRVVVRSLWQSSFSSSPSSSPPFASFLLKAEVFFIAALLIASNSLQAILFRLLFSLTHFLSKSCKNEISSVSPYSNSKAGKHVLCDKPFAMNVKEAEAMVAEARARPRQLALVDHELRYLLPLLSFSSNSLSLLLPIHGPSYNLTLCVHRVTDVLLKAREAIVEKGLVGKLLGFDMTGTMAKSFTTPWSWWDDKSLGTESLMKTLSRKLIWNPNSCSNYSS